MKLKALTVNFLQTKMPRGWLKKDEKKRPKQN